MLRSVNTARDGNFQKGKTGGAGLWIILLLALTTAGIAVFFFQDNLFQEAAEAPQEEIRSLEALVEAYIEGQGGMESIQNVKSLRMQGRFYPEEGAGPIPFSIVKKRPDKMRSFFNFPLFSRVQSFDGEKGWQLLKSNLEPGENFQRLTDNEIQQLAQDAHFDHVLIRQYGDLSRLRFLGKQPFQGEDFYWIEVLTDNFQRKKVLLLSTDKFRDLYHLMEDPSTGIQEVIHFQDFTRVGGLHLATHISSRTEGSLNWKMVIENIEMNIGVSNFYFEPPEDTAH